MYLKVILHCIKPHFFNEWRNQCKVLIDNQCLNRLFKWFLRAVFTVAQQRPFRYVAYSHNLFTADYGSKCHPLLQLASTGSNSAAAAFPGMAIKCGWAAGNDLLFLLINWLYLSAVITPLKCNTLGIITSHLIQLHVARQKEKTSAPTALMLMINPLYQKGKLSQ